MRVLRALFTSVVVVPIFACSGGDPSGGSVGKQRDAHPGEQTAITPAAHLDRTKLAKLAKYDQLGGREVFREDGLVERSHEATQGLEGWGQLNLTLSRGTINPVFCDTLTFQRDAFGDPILAGQNLSTAYDDAGISIGATNRSGSTAGVPIAFDSSNPTAGDPDLGTPNCQYGGPGVGSGGASNDRPLGNLLIKAEHTIDTDGDGLVDRPDDDANGGWLKFAFNEDKCVGRADLVDVEHAEVPARLRMYDDAGNMITELHAGGLGDNSVEHVVMDVCGVRELQIGLRASGAVHDVSVCSAPEPPTQLFLDLDLYQVANLEFDLTIKASNGTTETTLGQGRYTLDPLRVVRGGTLLPFPLVAGAAVPNGDYNSFRVQIDNLEAVHADGTRVPVAGGIDEQVAHDFGVLDCGSTNVSAEWSINARIEGDLFGLGVGLDFTNVSSSLDNTGC